MSGLTADKLNAMLRNIQAHCPHPEPGPALSLFPKRPLGGLDIIERPPPHPKIQVRDDLEWVTASIPRGDECLVAGALWLRGARP